MQARDIMTGDVVSVHPDTPVPEIARLLLERRISAVPVLDADEMLVGMVSEGDLIGRGESARAAGGDWWLALVAKAGDPTEAPPADIKDRVARQVMSSPVVTVAEDTELSEIARLLSAYRIKRVPVVRGARVIGIVSRADLLRGLAAAAPAPAKAERPGLFGHLMAELDRKVLHHDHDSAATLPAAAPAGPSRAELAAAKFQGLVKAFKLAQVRDLEAKHEADVEQRRERTAELTEHHLSDQAWQSLLQRAEEAAKRGATEFLMLRFPSQLCSDGGRAVNVPESTWPETLRGEPAELYLRWEREVKPHGFALTARVLDYPGGMPGDIGLFLSWGEADA